MKKLILIPLFALTVLADTNTLRTIATPLTSTNALTWFDDQTNVTKFNIYLGDLKIVTTTNGISTQAVNFSRTAQVSTKRWPGDATRPRYGLRPLYITCLTALGEESDPSEIVIVNFRAGVPLAPTGITVSTNSP